MKYIFELEGFDGHELAVEQRVFSAPRLLLDNAPAPAGPKPLEYLLTTTDGIEVPIRLQSSQFGSTVDVVIGDQVSSIMAPLQWYEWMWLGVPLLLILGGGMIGGAIGGLCAFLNMRIFRSQTSPLAKYGITGAISTAGILAFFLAAIILAILLEVVAGISKGKSP
jgi:hypothetical protein